jgi:acetoin utilization deacetylase AcuC-like enzyme
MPESPVHAPSASRPRPLLVVDDALFDEHRSRGYHPERPERLEAARRAVSQLAAEGVPVRRIDPRDATDDELARAHEPSYLSTLAATSGSYAALDADTYLAPRSVDAARRAAGGGLALVDALLGARGEPGLGVALLRPPGHHATRARGMGFCLFNNVAVAARHAIEQHGLSRVAIVDWDVHHGNGTQDIFLRDPSVLYVSLHQWPLYPGSGAADETGAGEGRGYNVNVPLSPGANDAAYEAAFDRVVLPVLDEYAPELVLVSAGFDAHARDPLAGMRATEAGFAAMARGLGELAAKRAAGRIALFLEGGYDLPALEASLGASLRALTAAPSSPPAETRAPAAEPLDAEHEADLARARRAAGEHWVGL